MKCGHCRVDYFPDQKEFWLPDARDPDAWDPEGQWEIEYSKCPSCDHLNIDLVLFDHLNDSLEISRKSINPLGSSRNPCPIEVPNQIAEDYKEACLVIQDSPKASAALSRRCLQSLLREYAGVSPSNLSKEIDQVISNGKLPSHLADIVDAVRVVGNFAAHPTKSNSTGEIVKVEPAEAELNLDVLESLFDFYFVLPAKTKARKAAIDAKLIDAGKPTLK